jgi:hypothetical protein
MATCEGYNRKIWVFMPGPMTSRCEKFDLENSDLEKLEHAGIAQCIGLDALEIEEFGDTFVIRTQKLLVDLRFNRCALNLGESKFAKEFSFKS